jgi:hypothetical protein
MNTKRLTAMDEAVYMVEACADERINNQLVISNVVRNLIQANSHAV